MNIVFLDSHTLNPGDLSWAAIEALGKVTFHKTIAEKDIVNAARNAEILVTNKASISSDTIAQCQT
jgi:glycerate dehydrogenase